jgi:hypothetical protein
MSNDKIIKKYLDNPKKHINELYKTFPLTGDIIKMWEHQRWGNKIWWGWGNEGNLKKINRLTGCMPKRPKVGDKLLVEMADGRIGTCLIIETEYKSNPSDMFFCNVVFLDYNEVTDKQDKGQSGNE